ncbi:MAG: hypothetical protein ACP5NX_03305 [Candidatus Bilamarchaeaceae archaeon]
MKHLRFQVVDKSKTGFARYCPTFAKAGEVLLDNVLEVGYRAKMVVGWIALSMGCIAIPADMVMFDQRFYKDLGGFTGIKSQKMVLELLKRGIYNDEVVFDTIKHLMPLVQSDPRSVSYGDAKLMLENLRGFADTPLLEAISETLLKVGTQPSLFLLSHLSRERLTPPDFLYSLRGSMPSFSSSFSSDFADIILSEALAGRDINMMRYVLSEYSAYACSEHIPTTVFPLAAKSLLALQFCDASEEEASGYARRFVTVLVSYSSPSYQLESSLEFIQRISASKVGEKFAVRIITEADRLMQEERFLSGAESNSKYFISTAERLGALLDALRQKGAAA